MPLPLVFFIGFVVVCVAGIATWSRLAATNRRIIEAPAGAAPTGAGPAGQEPAEFFRGGVMCRFVVTSGAMVRLEFFDWGVRLRGTAMSSWLVPTWEARYDELAIAELVALPASRIAVWLRLRDGGGGIAFLSDRSEEILPQLTKRGVPVNRSVTMIRRVAELYQ